MIDTLTDLIFVLGFVAGGIFLCYQMIKNTEFDLWLKNKLMWGNKTK